MLLNSYLCQLLDFPGDEWDIKQKHQHRLRFTSWHILKCLYSQPSFTNECPSVIMRPIPTLDSRE